MSDLTFRKANSDLRLKSLREMLTGLLPDDPGDLIDGIEANPSEGIDQHIDTLRQRMPEKYRFLLQKVADFSSQDIPLADFSRKLQESERFGLEVGGGVGIRLNKSDDALDTSGSLMGFAVKGGFNFGSSAKASSGVLSMGINAAADASRTVEYHMASKDGDYVLASLLSLKSVLADPSDLQAIVKRMDETNLRRVVRKGESTATLGMQVALGKAFSRAYPEAGIDLSGQVGASLAIEYNDNAVYSLSVEKTAHDYVAMLDKTRVSKTSSMLKLGVDVKLVGLRKRLLDKISVLLPEGEEISELIHRLDEHIDQLSEEHLKAKLGVKLKALWPQAEPVFKVILGEQTTIQLADQIREELKEKIEDAISAKVDLLNDSASTGAARVAATVAAELKLPVGLSSLLETYLQATVEGGIKDVQAKFDASADSLIARDRIAGLLQPLDFVSTRVSTVVAEASATVAGPLNELSGALKDVYGRYTKFRQGIIDAVKTKFQEQFAISVIQQKSRTETLTHALTVHFGHYDRELGKLYANMWNGDMRELADLARAADKLGHVSIEGEYIRTVQRVENTQLDVNIFGLGISTKSAFSDTVAVGFDYSGKLVVAESQGSLAKSVSLLGEAQTIKAEWNIDYLKRSVLDAPVTLSLEVVDKEFESGKEVERFFEPLVEAKAMRPGIVTRVETLLFDGSHRPLKNAVLSLKVPITWRGWLNLMENSSPEELSENFVAWLRVVAPDRVEDAEGYMERTNLRDLTRFLLWLGQFRTVITARRKMGISSGESRRFNSTVVFAQLVWRMKRRLNLVQESWSEIPRGAEIAENEAAFETQVQDFNKDFAKLFSGIVMVNIADRNEVNWRTAATIGMLMELDEDVDRPNPFVPCTVKADNFDEVIIS